MRTNAFHCVPLLLALTLTVAAVAGPPPIPATPAAVDDILYARPFTLLEPYRTPWQAERPLVREGMILVLQVNPDLVLPRQTLEPVLYVGERTAERVNAGYPSGRVVAIVPGAVDLEKSPIWFGEPALPERVTVEGIAAQRARAVAAGIGPLPAERVRQARLAGGDAVVLGDEDALRRQAAELMLDFVHDEAERAEGILAPRVGGE